MESFYQDHEFVGQDLSSENFAEIEFDGCDFSQCNFSGNQLLKTKFIECTFQECNFSSCLLPESAWRDVVFIRCKILGVDFSTINSFGFEVKFSGCQLNYSSFFQLKMENTRFEDCNLSDVDFTGSNLNRATFSNCDLNLAVFDNTLLEGTDLNTSYGFRINPHTNHLSNTKISREHIEGVTNFLGVDIPI